MTDRIPTTDAVNTDEEEVRCESCSRTDRDLVCGECGTPGGGCTSHPTYLYCVSCWEDKCSDQSRVFPLHPHL